MLTVLALIVPAVSASANDSTGGYQSCSSGTTVWIYSWATDTRTHHWTPSGSQVHHGQGYRENNTGRQETAWQVTTGGTITGAGAPCVPTAG